MTYHEPTGALIIPLSQSCLQISSREVPLVRCAGGTIGRAGEDLEPMSGLAVTHERASSKVKGKKEKVDALEESTEFFGGGETLRTIQPFPEADRLLRAWLRGGGVGGLTARI